MDGFQRKFAPEQLPQRLNADSPRQPVDLGFLSHRAVLEGAALFAEIFVMRYVGEQSHHQPGAGRGVGFQDFSARLRLIEFEIDGMNPPVRPIALQRLDDLPGHQFVFDRQGVVGFPMEQFQRDGAGF